jgi:hypothetical protein
MILCHKHDRFNLFSLETTLPAKFSAKCGQFRQHNGQVSPSNEDFRPSVLANYYIFRFLPGLRARNVLRSRICMYNCAHCASSTLNKMLIRELNVMSSLTLAEEREGSSKAAWGPFLSPPEYNQTKLPSSLLFIIYMCGIRSP